MSLEMHGIKNAAVLPEPGWCEMQNPTKFDDVRTSLSNADHVMASQNRRNGVSLDGGWVLVSAQLDVLDENRVNTGVLELQSVRIR
jgi:hypothetical protein